MVAQHAKMITVFYETSHEKTQETKDVVLKET